METKGYYDPHASSPKPSKVESTPQYIKRLIKERDDARTRVRELEDLAEVGFKRAEFAEAKPAPLELDEVEYDYVERPKQREGKHKRWFTW